MVRNPGRVGRGWWILGAALLASCTTGDEDVRVSRSGASVCPEGVRISSRGEPIGLVSNHVRYCWPGEANCYCDRDNDCYAQAGYVACTPPPADAGADAAADSATDAARDVTDASVDSATDASSDVARDVTDASLDSALDASADASRDAVGYCPEAVRTSARGEPIGVTSNYVRYCWPGEANCYCDRDNDCYAQAGYVACTPLPATDAGATDTGATDTGVTDTGVTDAARDAAADAATDATTPAGVCPEAVTISARGNPIGVSSGHIRWCWPGEANCYCDRDNDCYRLAGYVPCTPPGTVDAGTSDAPPLAPDPVAYTGALSSMTNAQVTSTITVGGTARTVWSYVPATRPARPPLVIAYHGVDLDGQLMLQGIDAANFATTNGVVVLAPNARYQDAAHGDFNRPAGGAVYWETAYNTNPDTNPDLLLTRALIVEAQRVFNTDPNRVYVVGFSNGGFMALQASVVLRDRIAGFAESNAGLVTCATRADCAFTGSTLACGTLSTEPGYCACSGTDKPIALPTTGGRPGFLWHAAQDPTVSVYYTCTLDARMTARGIPHRVTLWNGNHSIVPGFMTAAWAYLSPFVR